MVKKNSACQVRRHRFDPWVRKIPLDNEMATHSSILAWEITCTEEPGRLFHGVAKEVDTTTKHTTTNPDNLIRTRY